MDTTYSHPFVAAEMSDEPTALGLVQTARGLAHYLQVFPPTSTSSFSVADFLRDLLDSGTAEEACITRDEVVALATAFDIRSEV